MGWVFSFPVLGALSCVDTLEVSCHSPTRVLLSAMESIEGKRQQQGMSVVMQKSIFCSIFLNLPIYLKKIINRYRRENLDLLIIKNL